MKTLPNNWVETTLSDVAEIYDSERKPVNSSEREKRISGKEKSELYPYYGATGQVGYIDNYIFNDEFVLLGEDGAPFLEFLAKKAFIVRGKFWVNNHAHILKSKTSNKFLCFFLNQFDYHNFVTGTTRYKLTQSDMCKIPIPLPPLAEQGRIVAKIEELFAGIDAGVENLKAVKNQIALYRQSVLKSAFDGTLYKTTEWNFTSIGTVCDINPKTVLPDFSDDSIVSFLPMPTVEAETGAFSPETVEYKKVKKGYTKFQNNDVLFAKITPCMENGKSCVVHDLIQGVGFGSTEFHVLRCHAGMLPEYVFYFVVQKAFRSKAISFMTGAVGQKRVPADYLRDCEIPVPTLAEQEKIVAEIESRFERADALETAVDRALNDAEKLKQAVLKKAFRGELVPQNPDDEPASVLLDRIRAARASELPAKKGKRK